MQRVERLEDGRIVYAIEISIPTAADLYNPFDRPDTERPEEERPEGDEKRQRVV